MAIMRSKILLMGLVLLASACLQDMPTNTFDEQLQKDIQAIDDYLDAHPGSPSDIIVRDASGVRVVITAMGTGTIPPNFGNNLKVAYSGSLLSNGAVFDFNDSYLLKLSDGVIVGWKIGLSLITQGTYAKIYIPSAWGYGTTGQGPIPANANLVFDIHLIDVVPTVQQENLLASDITAIDNYLVQNEITAVSHSSGIRYVITQEGTGDVPTLYDQVKINYSVKLLTTGAVIADQIIEPGPTFSSRVVNYPHGVLVGLQLLSEGGKATFYVPSVLANGVSGVPANSNVIFEIELLDVIH
jgi:FKBP-type peptidyl-prolyl cis-trans isomerase